MDDLSLSVSLKRLNKIKNGYFNDKIIIQHSNAMSYFYIGVMASHWLNFDTPDIERIAEAHIRKVKDEEVNKFKKEHPRQSKEIDGHLESIYVRYVINSYVSEQKAKWGKWFT